MQQGPEDDRPLLKNSRSTSSENSYGTVTGKDVEEGGEDLPHVMVYKGHTKKQKLKRISSMFRVVAMTALIVLAVVRSLISLQIV